VNAFGWFGRRFARSRRPRILCGLVHYFGSEPEFVGKSTNSAAEQRLRHVRKAAANLRRQRGVEVRVCGIGGCSLVPVDIDFSGLQRPEHLVYEALNWIADQLDDYDYFMVVEDDILVPRHVLENILAFDQGHAIDECLHPNRLERRAEGVDCVDLRAMPGWQDRSMSFRGVELRVAKNPHSGFLMLSREKFSFGLERIDRAYRGRFLGGFMSSAFAHYHRPFALYRPYRDLQFHSVVHLDHWLGPVPN
jgi:hypothetical protein